MLHANVYGAVPPDGFASSVMHGSPTQMAGASGRMSRVGFSQIVTNCVLVVEHPVPSVTLKSAEWVPAAPNV